MKQVYVFSLLTGCFFIFFMYWWFSAPSATQLAQKQASLHQAKLSEHSGEITMKHLTLHEIKKSNQTGWILQSLESIFFKSLNVIECKNITCTLMTNDQSVAIIHAKKSIINRYENNLFLPGSVHGTFKGLELSGKDIHYSFSSHKLTTQQKAHYKHALFSLSAGKSFIDLKEKKIVLTGGVESEFLNSSTTNNSGN